MCRSSSLEICITSSFTIRLGCRYALYKKSLFELMTARICSSVIIIGVWCYCKSLIFVNVAKFCFVWALLLFLVSRVANWFVGVLNCYLEVNIICWCCLLPMLCLYTSGKWSVLMVEPAMECLVELIGFVEWRVWYWVYGGVKKFCYSVSFA